MPCSVNKTIKSHRAVAGDLCNRDSANAAFRFCRVGRPANLPVPFPVDVSFFYVGTDSKAQKLDVEETASAACYVGRDADSKPVHRLVLSEQTCDQIERAILALDNDNLHQSARASLTAVKADRRLFTRFERGEIEMPSETARKPVVERITKCMRR